MYGFNPISLEVNPSLLESVSPSDYKSALDRNRAYNGQSHTDLGERGKTELVGITMRDVRDCFILAAFDSAGTPEESRGCIYDLDMDDIDPVAWSQNLARQIEKRMSGAM